jgi:phage recombination protein Bet
MSLNNRLTKPAEPKKQGVIYEVDGQKIELTPSIVKDYLVSGNKDLVTMQEVVMFINLCKNSGLNPWLKEAYLIKYSNNEPATLVTAKEAFQKRAEDNPFYDGAEAGIIVYNKETGEVTYRLGTMKFPEEEVIGGYAEVWRKDRAHSTRIEVSFEEYAGRKKDGTLNGQWQKKPATMIRKVALVQALREAFPKAFGGLYTAEEQGTVETETSMIPTPDIIDMPIIEEPQPEKTESSDNGTQADVKKALFGDK